MLDEHGPEMLVRYARETGAERVVASVGGLGGGGEDAGAEALLRVLSGEGLARLIEAMEETSVRLAELGTRLCVRPGAGEVVSDIPSCLTLLRSPVAARVGLVVEPAGLLTPSMVERADDHLERIYSALGEHPGVDAVVLSSPDARARPVGLHHGEGLVDGRRVIELAARFCGPGVDWMILDDEPAGQVELLRMYGPGV